MKNKYGRNYHQTICRVPSRHEELAFTVAWKIGTLNSQTKSPELVIILKCLSDLSIVNCFYFRAGLSILSPHVSEKTILYKQLNGFEGICLCV